MKRVMTTSNAAEAHVNAAVLENAGIAAQIRGEFMGGIPVAPISTPSLWVADEDYDAACEVLGVAPELPAAPSERGSPTRVLVAIAIALLVLIILQRLLL